MIDNDVIVQQTDLEYIKKKGYFKGYKGYRILEETSVTDIEKVKALNKFDIEVKKLISSDLLTVETNLKNIFVNLLGESEHQVTYYSKLVEEFYFYNPNSRKSYEEFKLDEKLFFYRKCQQKYSNMVIKHYLEAGNEVPIWAYIEILTFGEFNRVVIKLKDNLINCFIGSYVDQQLIPTNWDNKKENKRILNYLSWFRNVTMHNNITYDLRNSNFTNSSPSQTLNSYMQNYTGLSNCNFNFDSILDYMVLLKIVAVKVFHSTIDGPSVSYAIKEVVNNLSQVLSQQEVSGILKHNYSEKIDYLENETML